MNLCTRCRKIISIFLHKSKYIKGPSYYPECAHKTPWQIVFDQIHFVWKYGYVEEYYYTYGFDRLEMTRERMEEYIVPYRAFLHRTDYLNSQNPYYDDFMGKMTCRVINQDKFFFYIFLSRLGFPTPNILCYVKNQRILYVDNKFEIDKELPVRDQLKQLFSNDLNAFAKPSDGMLGRGAFKLLINDSNVSINDRPSCIDELIDMLLSADYIVQELIVQDDRMSELCPSSVNTIRLQTVMDKDGNVIPFGPGVRIGRLGNHVDNWALGGVFVGIDSETGRLKDKGILKPKYGTKVIEHPDTHVVFKDYPIPFYKEAEEIVIQLHKLMYRSHSIGWDIAITPNGPTVIEGNDRWEVSLVQAVHGGLGYLKYLF